MKLIKPKLFIAGGGTGGHIFPALAIAKAWQENNGKPFLVGTNRGLEKDLYPKYSYPFWLLKTKPIKGMSFINRLKALLGLPLALFKCIRLILKNKPDVVIGVGGYASAPMVLAASFLNIPTAILDQNSVPGLTNRLLGLWARRVFLAFDHAKQFFYADKIILSGNPSDKNHSPSNQKTKNDEFWNLLIIGGSQGAVQVNRWLQEIFDFIYQQIPNLKVWHQTGKRDFATIQKWAKGKSNYHAFAFDPKLDSYLKNADLVISRAGAMSVSEIALMGKASILIPYPFAADDHQHFNAQEFVENKASFLLDQNKNSASDLANLILKIYQNPKLKKQMEKNAQSLAYPDASQKIVTEIKNLMEAQ